MIRSQIYLTEEERQCLSVFSQETGRSQSDLIREAIDQYIEWQYQQKKTFTHCLHATKGLWKSKKDLVPLDELRTEWERNFPYDEDDEHT